MLRNDISVITRLLGEAVKPGETATHKEIAAYLVAHDVRVVHPTHWVDYGASYTMIGGVPARCSACGRDSLRFDHCPSCGKPMKKGVTPNA